MLFAGRFWIFIWIFNSVAMFGLNKERIYLLLVQVVFYSTESGSEVRGAVSGSVLIPCDHSPCVGPLYTLCVIHAGTVRRMIQYQHYVTNTGTSWVLLQSVLRCDSSQVYCRYCTALAPLRFPLQC